VFSIFSLHYIYAQLNNEFPCDLAS